MKVAWEKKKKKELFEKIKDRISLHIFILFYNRSKNKR